MSNQAAQISSVNVITSKFRVFDNVSLLIVVSVLLIARSLSALAIEYQTIFI